MAGFRRYTHIERFGNDEVQGIELGECYIFPKIDGTNASVWSDKMGHIQCGSRNRHISLEDDNQGFCAYIKDNKEIMSYMSSYPNHRLYGEWLVPHSLKTYREDTWRRFYVFDVYDNNSENHLTYNEYHENLQNFNIEYIPPISIIKNASHDNLIRELEKNVYLVVDGKGNGEGIVIKNYKYRNRFGSNKFAKIVTSAFKEKHSKEMGPSIIKGEKMIEQEVIDAFLTKELVDKSYAKIVNERSGWSSKYIPHLFGLVYYDLINEEIWNIIKKLKSPTINFKTLHSLAILEIKTLRAELF